MQLCAIFIDVVQIIANICNQTLVNDFSQCPDQMWAHRCNRLSFLVVLMMITQGGIHSKVHRQNLWAVFHSLHQLHAGEQERFRGLL